MFECKCICVNCQWFVVKADRILSSLCEFCVGGVYEEVPILIATPRLFCLWVNTSHIRITRIWRFIFCLHTLLYWVVNHLYKVSTFNTWFLMGQPDIMNAVYCVIVIVFKVFTIIYYIVWKEKSKKKKTQSIPAQWSLSWKLKIYKHGGLYHIIRVI